MNPKTEWYFAVDPVTNEYLEQNDEAFSLRCQARENAIYEAADRLGIPRKQLEHDDYVGMLNEDAFVDMENAEKYLKEKYGE